VVSRTLLGVALGTTIGCAKNHQVRIGQPPPDEYLRIGQPPPQEDPIPVVFTGRLQGPDGVDLPSTSVTVRIDGQEALVTTDEQGVFELDGVTPYATIEILVEGYEPLQTEHSGATGQIIVLTPSEGEPPSDAPPTDAPPP
jgi:hypothetical protein